MHCPSLMTPMHTSEGFVPFLQELEHSTWQHPYMFYIRRTIQSNFNYQLVWYSLKFRICHKGSLSGLRRSRWVYHLINWCLLLADQYSTRISNILSRWYLHDWAISTKSVCQTVWVQSDLYRESNYWPSLQREFVRRGTAVVFTHGLRDWDNV